MKEIKLRDMLQSLDGQTVKVHEIFPTVERHLVVSVEGKFKLQHEGSGNPCIVGDCQLQFWAEDIEGVTIRREGPPLINLRKDDV